jgi:hypothetical protein
MPPEREDQREADDRAVDDPGDVTRREMVIDPGPQAAAGVERARADHTMVLGTHRLIVAYPQSIFPYVSV